MLMTSAVIDDNRLSVRKPCAIGVPSGDSGRARADRPEPQAGPAQMVIDVYPAGVNFPDVVLVQGLYQVKPPLPFSRGVGVAGMVASVGEGVREPRVGDRVAAGVMGGFAEK